MKKYRIRNTINEKYYIEQRLWLFFWFEVRSYKTIAAITVKFDSLEGAEKWIEEEKIMKLKCEDKKRNFKRKVWYR